MTQGHHVFHFWSFYALSLKGLYLVASSTQVVFLPKPQGDFSNRTRRELDNASPAKAKLIFSHFGQV